jgi:methyltransferase-like protein
LLGHWKNFEELEENLSLAELNQILESARKARKEQNTFLAALKGIDLNKNEQGNTAFEEVKKRAEARLRGMSEEQLDLSEVGILIETEDE